jgi:hypothetical protein
MMACASVPLENLVSRHRAWLFGFRAISPAEGARVLLLDFHFLMGLLGNAIPWHVNSRVLRIFGYELDAQFQVFPAKSEL